MSHFLPRSVVESQVPKYPATASAVGADGLVRVKILVNRRGTVRKACVVEGHPLLQASALEAAYAFKFSRNFGLSNLQPKTGPRFIQDYLSFNFHLDR